MHPHWGTVMIKKPFHRLITLLALSLGLAACGGGSGGSSDPVAQNPATPAQTATVTVLLTDAPSPDWDRAIATITSIELLGDSATQTIFSGNAVVDLLSLPDFYDVFAIADDVQPGTYSKIRLRVDSLELVELDDSGAVVQSVMAQLVGGGKIDLNPQGSFFVGGGDTLFVEIDFDMNKAFKTTETGNGKHIVRPVIMVRILREEPAGRLTRLRGFVNAIDTDSGRFLLCQSELVAAMHDDDEGEHDDDHDQGCIPVTTDALTGLFGTDGLPIDFGALRLNDEVTAIGRLRRDEDDDDDDDFFDDDDSTETMSSSQFRDEHEYHDDLLLEAVTVEVGADFRRVAGIAENAIESDSFDLALEPGQNLGTEQSVLATQLFEKTRIFGKEGTELDRSAIAADVGVLADGVLVSAEGEPDRLRAALLIVDLGLSDAEIALSGEIVSVDFDAGSFQLMVGETERCVDARTADIFLVSNSDGFLIVRGDLGDLEAMQRADVFGMTENEAGCLVATHVLAAATPGNTLPVANAGDDAMVAAGEPVTLDGSGSSDADGDDLSYSWQFVSVPETSMAELATPDMSMASFTADQPGEYVIQLIVNDGLEDSAPDTVTITAAAPL
jgi:hypothetical protein